jgi:cysteine-rich repeat protein
MMTRSLTLLGTSLLVVLAAACGDDSGNNGTCGDGHVTGTETCDDGNRTSGDGCSSSCKDEGLCGNGTFDVSSEECDDGNKTNGDGCSSTCKQEGTCGNGMVEPGETCDDANTMSTDGCNAACAVEVGFMCDGMPSMCSPTSGGGTCAAPGIIALTAMGADLVGTGDGDTTIATNGLPAAECDGDDAGYGNEV